jgi:hypothetical protein
MTKIFLVTVFFSFSCLQSIAQTEAKKKLKEAEKAFSEDKAKGGGTSLLFDAKGKVEEALKDAEVKKQAAAWLLKGKICTEIAKSSFNKNEKDPVTGDTYALLAYQAFMKVYEGSSTTASEKADVIKSLDPIAYPLLLAGNELLGKNNNAKAFLHFQAAIRATYILPKSPWMDDSTYLQIVEMAGYTASGAGIHDEAYRYYKEIYEHKKLYAAGNIPESVYYGFISASMETQGYPATEKLIAEAKKKYPKSNQWLFTEINLYMKWQNFSELIPRLKKAIELEPANAGLYLTMAQVNEKLWQSEMAKSNTGNANMYFAEAKKYYAQASAKDPGNPDVFYSAGALFYNKAAYLSNEIQNNGGNQQKQQQLEAEGVNLLKEALPYFKKAENLSPNDINVLIALATIYKMLNDPLQKEFEKRLQIINNGGRNNTSYFK